MAQIDLKQVEKIANIEGRKVIYDEKLRIEHEFAKPKLCPIGCKYLGYGVIDSIDGKPVLSKSKFHFWAKTDRVNEIKDTSYIQGRHRPQDYFYEKNDCTVRALCAAVNLPYEKAHAMLKEAGRKDRDGVRFNTYFADKLFKMAGVNVHLVENEKAKTAKSLIALYPNSDIYCCMRSHAFAINRGKISDSTSENVHILNAWIVIKGEVKFKSF